MTAATHTLPIPSFYDETLADKIWQVPYGQRAQEAKEWARRHAIGHVSSDRIKIALMGIDEQNTFCVPSGELFVAGRSGMGAVEDTKRFCEFIYRNMSVISHIALTMDTHWPFQIFHPGFWVNEAGEHPAPFTFITVDEVRSGTWKVNPSVAYTLTEGNYMGLQNHALHYVNELAKQGKYSLTIWPYHAILGGVGHTVVASIDEATFFHSIARNSQREIQIKGGNPVTENYSVLKPEVLTDHQQHPIARKNTKFIETLLKFDVVVIAGQAKSHCVAWTIDDLLTEILAKDPSLAAKVYLLEDCSSPVVATLPDGTVVYDGTADADAAYDRFKNAGMHVVRSTDPIASWPGINL